MGDMPDYTIDKADPFTAVALDLFGPLWAKGIGGYGRKTFKVWGVLFVCLSTKAVSIWAAPSYSTRDFLLCYTKHTTIYGEPQIVISDHGTQLVSAGSDINWAEIQHLTAPKRTVWQFTPKGCAWRNGMAERSIAIAKSTLTQVINKHQTLNFAEFETAMVKVAGIMNKRPLTARAYNEDEYIPISPSDLLLGKATNLENRVITSWQDKETDGPVQLSLKLQNIERVVEDWWKVWLRDAFPLFCPRRKWTIAQRNLAIGDIVMLRYEQKFGKDRYRLAKVTKIHPDKHKQVRTVTISLRDHKKANREPPNQVRTPQVEMVVGVQRLVVILPCHESWKGGLMEA